MDHSTPHPIIPDRKRLALLIGSLCLIVLCNDWAVTYCRNATLTAAVALSALFVLQVTLISVAIGYGDFPDWLKWATLFWIFVLIDLQLTVIPSSPYDRRMLPIAALYASQMGIFLTWLIMGRAEFMGRLSVTLLFTAAVMISCIRFLRHEWFSIVFCYLFSLAACLVLLRCLGFRMSRVDENQSDEKIRNAQFGLRHALILTTILALLMGLMRYQGTQAVNLMKDVFDSTTVIVLILGLASAITSIITLWSAMGRGHLVLRCLVFLVVVAGTGSAISYWFTELVPQLWLSNQAFFSRSSYTLGYLVSLKWTWLAWSLLSSLMMAGSLLFFRSRQLRFIRTQSD